ncbi:MAG: hypothetical protein JXA64_01260 [Candidatus Fermentibacteraceae bacterium]|nr:hypothetical protein [Candidatus Fermentibacteraceae bacterium]MBN2607714.1 hypothetical protein [Candidatus Fermentibacteraceae bacterium]
MTLYLIIHRADGYWLKDIGAGSSWTTGFDPSDCMVSAGTGTSFPFSFPEYTTGYGSRMYIGNTAFEGEPDLATYEHVYDKVEMGWNAVWNIT